MISKSPFLNRLNQFAHILMAITFSPYVSQIILHQQHFSFGENKTKGNGKCALYLIAFLIILNVKLC